ncbi:MAG: twin-arginine translocation pathway signal protein [Burkholderiales bacterium]|nr:MAG: twin-arginine translocation pathway signal protein [Burkholderiales bacterium]
MNDSRPSATPTLPVSASVSPARRGFIRVIGSSAVIAAAVPTLPGCSAMPDAATEAWFLAGRGEETRRRLLSWAILAPNPHNLQPWTVELPADGSIVLFSDPTRTLPMTDPPSRQLTIGHGAFLELLSMAAAAEGLRAEIEPFPAGEPGPERLDARPIARVRLRRDGIRPDPLFAMAGARTTWKKPFAARAVAPEALAALQAAATRPGVAASGTQDPARVAALNDVMVRAWEIEQRTPRTWKESVDLTRVGAAEIARHRDGISLGGPLMELLRLAGQMTPEKAMDPNSTYFTSGIDRVRAWAPATGTWLWLRTAADGRVPQLEAGRAFVRLQLQAAALGLVTQPPSQVLQEYPEMRALQREFKTLVGQRAGEKVQMLVRVGHPDGKAVRSPRRALQDLIRA